MNKSDLSKEVFFDAFGSTRLITLNREKALNALNLNMVERMLISLQVRYLSYDDSYRFLSSLTSCS